MGRPKKIKDGDVELNYVEVKDLEVPSQDLKEREDFEVVDNALDREGNPSETPSNKLITNGDEYVPAMLTNEYIISKKQAEGGIEKLKELNTAPEGIADVQAWADAAPQEAVEAITEQLETDLAENPDALRSDIIPEEPSMVSDIPDDTTKREAEEVHVMGHNIVLGRMGTYIRNIEFPIDEEVTETVTMESSNTFPPDEEPIPDVEDEGIEPDDIIDQLITRKPFTLEEELILGGEAKVTVGNPRAGQNAKHSAVRNVYTPRANGEATNAPRISSSATGVHKKPSTVKSVEGGRSGMFRIDKNRPIKN